MSSFVEDGDAVLDDRNAAVIKIATESRTMLGLVEGHPEFERLASILERARSEALRILDLHGLSLPPPPSGREAAEDDASPKA